MAGTITHSWDGTILTITSDSGTSSMDLRGGKGDTGARGARGLPGKAGGGARIEDGVISDETTWSSSGIIDRFAELMGINANPAVLDNPYPNFPLQITTTFEPKQEGSGEPSPDNIRQISGFNNAKITRCGKNLLSKAAAGSKTSRGITFTSNGDGSYTINGTSTGSISIEFAAEVPITIPVGAYLHVGNTGVLNGNIAFVPHFTDGTTVSLAFNVKNRVWKITDSYIGKTIDKIGIYVNGVQTVNITFKPMICMDATTGEFEPYQGGTFTVDFHQTIYGGTLDWNMGEMVVDKMGITLNGNEEWAKSTYGNHYNMPLADIVPTDENINHIVCCSHCIGIPYVDRGNYTKLVAGITNDNKIEFRNTGRETIEDWKAYLAAQNTAGTPVQICYKLATPTTIQLTPQEIKAIKGINTLYSNAQELTVIGRVDTMYQLSKLAERVAALEAR